MSVTTSLQPTMTLPTLTGGLKQLFGALAVAGTMAVSAQAAEPPADGHVERQQSRGILELSTRDTVLTVGGRIAMDTTLNWPDGPYAPDTAPLGDGTGENGQLKAHLRNSRLWLKTRTPTAWGSMQTLIEGDFYGSAGNEVATNSHNFRVRHAYMQVGGLMIGQNWSTFVPDATADTILDPVVMSWIRQPQVRWERRRDGRAYALALENPETTLTDPAGTKVVPGDDQLPDVVARVIQDSVRGRASAAVLLRQLRQDRATLGDGTTVLSGSDAALGWGACISGQVGLGGGDDLRLAAVYGNGIGRYVANDAFDAGSVDAQGTIEPQVAWGGYLALRHWWSRTLRSTVAYSQAGSGADDGELPAAANREVVEYQLNLFWTPFASSLFGLEYGRLERELQDGRRGDISTLYVRTLYNF